MQTNRQQDLCDLSNSLILKGLELGHAAPPSSSARMLRAEELFPDPHRNSGTTLRETEHSSSRHSPVTNRQTRHMRAELESWQAGSSDEWFVSVE
jgi:hypothetical protein